MLFLSGSEEIVIYENSNTGGRLEWETYECVQDVQVLKMTTPLPD